MICNPTPLPGAFLIEPRVLRDDRGLFYESFNLNRFEKATGLHPNFVQDNHSLSYYGVLRGLHFQYGSFAQAKLVRVLSGSVLDIIVDLRPESSERGKSYSVILSSENRKQLFVPRGMAHGFVTLTDYAEFVYKCDNFYSPDHESGIRYDDPDLQLEWQLPGDKLLVSAKDQALPSFKNANYSFD